jgi:hypothetical protein
MFQDHKSHIQIHMAMMNDPKVKQLIGQNPQAPVIAAAMQAHITEHVGMEYQRQLEQMAGISIPSFDDEEKRMSPEMEMQITQMAVPFAQQLLNQNQTEIAAQQAQQAAQDPIIQMQLQELQLKAKEVEMKMKKLQIDAASKADQLEIEKQRLATQEKIAGMQVGAKIQSEKAHLASKERLEGMKIGNDIGKAKAQMSLQERQIQNKPQPSNKETK